MIAEQIPSAQRDSQRLEAQLVERAYSLRPEPPVLRVGATMDFSDETACEKLEAYRSSQSGKNKY